MTWPGEHPEQPGGPGLPCGHQWRLHRRQHSLREVENSALKYTGTQSTAVDSIGSPKGSSSGPCTESPASWSASSWCLKIFNLVARRLQRSSCHMCLSGAFHPSVMTLEPSLQGGGVQVVVCSPGPQSHRAQAGQ